MNKQDYIYNGKHHVLIMLFAKTRSTHAATGAQVHHS